MEATYKKDTDDDDGDDEGDDYICTKTYGRNAVKL